MRGGGMPFVPRASRSCPTSARSTRSATIGGAGTIAADGGTQSNANHTGGGGGRVAIHADAVDASSDLLAARRATAYGGDGSSVPAPHDLVTWLDWCRRFPSPS